MKFDFTKSFQRTVAAYERLSPSKKADYERSQAAAKATLEHPDNH